MAVATPVQPLIRPANPADLPAMLEIERQSFRTEHWGRDHFLKYDCIVAEVAGAVEGFLVSREVYAGDEQAPPEREILNVAVAKGFRRSGIATTLLKHELGSGAVVFLEVRESNAPARALYEKLGFGEIARRADYYAHPRETAIVMRLK
jgi:ribosomal protein S18 acetylase RimI-like enzyme